MSTNPEINNDKPVITGLFAHYCGPWEYSKYTQELFAQRGYDMLLPDLPIDDPDATYDDHAEIVREAQQQRGAGEYIDIGHSWSGDIIYRQLGSAPVSMLIFLAAPLRPVQEKSGLSVDRGSQSISYSAYVAAEKSDQVIFDRDRESLGDAIFSGIGNKAVKGWATNQLRYHPHKRWSQGSGELDDGEPTDPNAVLPTDLPMEYLGLEKDKVFAYAAQVQTAGKLGIPFSSFTSCHFPMLDSPKPFVNRIITMIEDKADARQQALENLYTIEVAT
ncbi:hypothetical protein KW792_00205 [Candidatus Saccharibacteria bacterium]|nr:hypothetical protein [Candidatus Saccharibacteria bacterium]